MLNILCENKAVYTPNDSRWYPTSWGVLLPRYPGRKIGWVGSGIRSGLYLGLCCGYKTPEDKRFDGPMIGPLCYVRTIYMDVVQLGFMDPYDAGRYFPGEDEDELCLDTS